MADLPEDLSDALEESLDSADPAEMAQSVQKLMGRYREEFDPSHRALASGVDVAAYAAYRMPATYAAVAAALRHTAALTPGFRPRAHADVGGGTGAAVWAAAATWPSVEEVTVLEQAREAIAFGRRLARKSRSPAVRDARWRQTVIDGQVRAPEADLVTMSYVLGELPERLRPDVIRSLAGGGAMVVLVEPGTPAGYERVGAARDLLIDLGLSVVAPCPHDGTCPIPGGRDWCHFSARLNRTALHRRLKVGTLGFEDEKFSYVAAAPQSWAPSPGRIIRHPQKRKGLVSLRLCETDGLRDVTVSKRQGEEYRAARKADWGDAWPP